MAESMYLKQIHYEGRNWHMTYDPAVATTTAPNLTGYNVVNAACKTVNVPGQDKPLYMAVVDLVMPASVGTDGTVMPERRLKGFRLYPYQPASLESIKQNELVYYLAEPAHGTGSESQIFLDAVLGITREDASRAGAIDSDWSHKLLGSAKPPKKEHPTPPTEPTDSITMG